MSQEIEHDNAGRVGFQWKALLRRSVFQTLFLTMLTFGVFVGLLFPLFVKYTLNAEAALTLPFFVMCVAAGFLVGLSNFFLFKILVSRELARVHYGMRKIISSLDQAAYGDDNFQFAYNLEVRSHDLIGEMAHSFNEMTVAIADSIAQERLVRNLMSDLSTTVDPKQVAAHILQAMLSAPGVLGGILYSLQAEELDLLVVTGLDESMRLPATMDGLSDEMFQAIKNGDVLEIPPEESCLKEITVPSGTDHVRPDSIIIVPLVTGSRTVGIMVLPSLVTYLAKERLQLVEMLGNHVAAYLQNALLHRKIGEMAALDWLTRILNRRFGMRRLREEFSRSLRHGSALSVILLDIDHFKRVNDKYGHAAGDAVLKEVAALLKGNIRTGEAVCRYGGEEFMIVAPGNDLHDANVLSERLRKLVENTTISWAGQDLRVTISLGVATWPIIPASVVNEIVSAADEALYFAKESGRNRVAIHQGDDVTLSSE